MRKELAVWRGINGKGHPVDASKKLFYNLNEDRPVAMCMLESNGFADAEKFKWHWMTITKYYQDTSDMRWVAFSSWGKRYRVNFRLMHNY